jgi:LmbE family N-acetylglucosaminyl deacetylase/CheY-like chemotaxis protein
MGTLRDPRRPLGASGPAGHVLLCDTHPDATRVAALLSGPGGFVVESLTDPGEAQSWLLTQRCDLVLVDPTMGGGRGCDLLRQARNLAPGTPVAALTGDDGPTARIDCGRTVPTLRRSDGDVELLVRVHRLIDATHVLPDAPTETVLAIGAHPDDVEIGVAGALTAHGAAGHAVNILTLSRGAEGGVTDLRVAESQAAATLLGARLFMEDLEDTRIPSGHPTVGLIERVVDLVAPTVVYTHSFHDTHQDHRAVHEATMVAARRVPRISCYQSPSATVDFRPNRFVPIADFVEAKQQAIDAFATQSDRDYLQREVVTATARYWGRFARATHAEALEVVRDSTALTEAPGMSIHPAEQGHTAPIREDIDVAS